MPVEAELPAREATARHIVVSWSGVVALFAAVISFTVTQQETNRNAKDLVLLQATVDAERERTRALATKDDVRRVEDRINFLIQELINDRSPR
jgi:hypothetical protein